MDYTPKMQLLKGKNEEGVKGIVLKPTPNSEVYAVPERALEVLDFRVDQVPVMWQNPAGHRLTPGGDTTDHIEAFFTAGLTNVGGPCLAFGLHGSFSLKSASDISGLKTKRLDMVSGLIDATSMVLGPYITVDRQVSVNVV